MATLPRFVFGIVCLVILIVKTKSETIKCESQFELKYSDDCKTKIQCVWGKPTVETCPNNLLFNAVGVCDYPNTIYGKCRKTYDDKQMTISELCEMDPSLIIPHRNCHQYYNCSEANTGYSESYLSQCQYPKQFSLKTKTCENFTDVECGNRYEEKEGCNYLGYSCRMSHCIPCTVNLPSCVGYSDGLHEHGTKNNSPWFMICHHERTVHTGMCPYDEIKGIRTFPVDGKCDIRLTD